MESIHTGAPWNKGKLIGQKPPVKPKDIWAIRIQLQHAHQVRGWIDEAERRSLVPIRSEP